MATAFHFLTSNRFLGVVVVGVARPVSAVVVSMSMSMEVIGFGYIMGDVDQRTNGRQNGLEQDAKMQRRMTNVLAITSLYSIVQEPHMEGTALLHVHGVSAFNLEHD